jgi:prepilin signal peptidase PulO-like enzyme (type II secretory pathway)
MIIWNLVLGGAAGYLVERASDWLPHVHPAGERRSPESKKHRWLQAASAVTGALFFVCAGQRFGSDLQAMAVFLAYCYFSLLALIDLKYQVVPNRLVYPAAIVVLLYFVAFSPRPIIFTLVGGLLAFTAFALTAYLKPNDLGGGDIKLAALIGLAFGFPGALWALLLGTSAGGISMFLLRFINCGQRLRQLPYAPFLCLGTIIAMLYNPTELLLSLYT